MDDVDRSKLPIVMIDAEGVGYMISRTPDSVRHLHRRGELPGRLCGGALRWSVEQVEAYAKSLFNGEAK